MTDDLLTRIYILVDAIVCNVSSCTSHCSKEKNTNISPWH